MRRLLKRCLPLSLALLVPAAVLASPARAAPPRGACHDPEPARPVVRQLPWAQQVLDPQQVWPHSTGTGVTVAVIDSGVDADHPQLRGKVLRGRDYFLVGTLPGNYDCVSHGTAVAGIIAAGRADGVGFQGLAPGARILPVRVSDREFNDSGQTQLIDPDVLARGIRYAVDQGARVINLSMSGEQDQRRVRSAVAYAVSKDVVVVAAAGNRQQNSPEQLPSYPAAYDGVVGVGAIDAAGARLPSSQTGPYVDLVAPGGAVLGLTRQGGHAYRDGTSFAAPFVAATAALVRSAWPKLTAAQVVQRLLATATPARGGTGSREYGAGIVSPFRAVTEGMMQAPARVGPSMVQPPADPDQLAVAAWWQAADAEARALTALLVAGAALVLAIALVLVAGRQRRSVAARTTIGRTPARVDDEVPPEHLFQPPRA
jgi:type VII secretion-associated serine protease mycosin